jgi:hypothetical protein
MQGECCETFKILILSLIEGFRIAFGGMEKQKEGKLLRRKTKNSQRQFSYKTQKLVFILIPVERFIHLD